MERLGLQRFRLRLRTFDRPSIVCRRSVSDYDNLYPSISATNSLCRFSYPIGGSVSLPHFKDYVIKTLNVDLSRKNVGVPLPQTYPEPVPCGEFLAKLQQHGIDFTQNGEDRLVRSHGQALHDIHALRTGQIKRIPDTVVFPLSHEQVVQVVQAATENDVVVIPYGGGTSVSGSASCPENEQRSIALLDTSQMNRMLWIDKENLVACFESGIIGQDLERELRKLGFTMGHEPDSFEFSSLGGWVATRASGMKKNLYGNIEDIVVKVKMVTAKGVLERSVAVPRISCGPDFNHIIMGSEGTLGVVTEVLVKIRPLPEVKKYGSLVFPNFGSGVRCLREVAKQRLQPASIRLIDNEQFVFGQALKPAGGVLSSLSSALQRAYITGVKGMDMEKIAIVTLVFEGTAKDVKIHEQKIFAIAAKHGGFSAGSTNGEKGYILTFVIAYIRVSYEMTNKESRKFLRLTTPNPSRSKWSNRQWRSESDGKHFPPLRMRVLDSILTFT